MNHSLLEGYATHELKYQARKCISKEIRDRFQDSDPMVTGVVVMLGTIVAMTAFSAMRKSGSGGRTR
ncbi:hypothetical protein BH10PLA2_BH10PLA2_39600 [soil metagenome]